MNCLSPNNTATGALEGPAKNSETAGAGPCVVAKGNTSDSNSGKLYLTN